MNFDYTTETITPDSTDILTIGGTGGLELPIGASAHRPVSPVEGTVRYNGELEIIEGFSDNQWVSLVKQGTVTSIDITQPAAGITLSGGPITSSGSISLSLSDDLLAIEDLSTNGLATRTSTNTWTTRTLTGTSDQISITNGDGVSGNPVVAISPNPVFPGTSAATLPIGTTGNRPASPTNGMVRYNTTLGLAEAYSNGTWRAMSGDTTWFSLNNATPVLQTRVFYSGRIVTTGSEVDFHITSNGTSTGTPLFGSLSTAVFSVTIQRATTADNQAPWGYVNSIQNQGRTVRVNIKKSNTGSILLGGNYQGNVNNNNEVTVHLMACGVL